MNKVKFLLVYYCDPWGLLTILDNVKNFQLLSKNEITLLNTYPKIKIPKEVNLLDFDGILIDSTLAYFPKTLNELDDDLSLKLKDYGGVKVLMKQDEHVHSHETARIIGEKKIDLVFSCLDESQISKVYPRNLVGEAQFVQQLTGYFSDNLINLANSMDYTRSIDLSYRGSIQPLQCGILGYEKWNIGHSVKKKLNGKNINSNISSAWTDRINGIDWIKFLSCSKGVLGVESGSNIFDFNGDVEKKCQLFEQNNSSLRADPDAYYKKAHQEFLFEYENNVKYAQISPRHFEATATRTLQILYEGNYSNIFVPYKHYLPLKRDLSNIEYILEVLFNAKKRNMITDCAYEEIAKNENYHYKKKIALFDLQIEEVISKKNIKSFTFNQSTVKNQKNVLILVPHQPHLDPRIIWLKEGFNDFANTCIVGTAHLADNVKWKIINDHTIEANLYYSDLPESTNNYEELYKDYYNLIRILDGFCGKHEIKFPNSTFYSDESISRFQWYGNYFKRTDQALRFTIDQLMLTTSTIPDLLICCDLSSLLSGVILSQQYQIPLVYDAHEFWAYSDVKRLPWEIDFWLFFEKVLLKYVDLPVTVSEGLAKKMSLIYKKEFTYVPNTELARNYLYLQRKAFQSEPLLDNDVKLPSFESETTVKFLYLGNYAPGRGLEQLIDAWREVNENYKLILRGPRWEYTDSLIMRAKEHGLYNRTVFFFKSVEESALVSTASSMDVGIIPYSQNASENYKYCCPNKLSQYMAAGIPILSNQLTEVAKVIKEGNCGIIVDFDLEQDLVNAIHMFGDFHLRQKMGNAGRKFFLEHYNWEKQAEPLYCKSQELMDKKNIFGQRSLISLECLAEGPALSVVSEIAAIFNVSEISKVSEVAEVADGLKSVIYALRALKHLITRKIKIFNPILNKIKRWSTT